MLLPGMVLGNEALISKFRVKVPDIGTLACSALGGLESKISEFTAEDGTTRSGARSLPGSTTASIFMHHETDRIGVLAWHRAGLVSGPGYKRDIPIEFLNGAGNPVTIAVLKGTWCSMIKTPDLDATSEGEIAKLEITLNYDTLEMS